MFRLLSGSTFFIIAILLAACSEDEIPIDNGVINAQDVRRLEVKIRHYYQLQPILEDSLLANVRVRIYATSDDRSLESNILGERTSDTGGVVKFLGINETFYYVRAYHPDLGEKDEEISTPEGALVNFLEIEFGL